MTDFLHPLNNQWITIGNNQNQFKNRKNFLSENYNFNIYKKNKKNSPIKCGALIFDEDLKHIVLVQNKYSASKGEEKWGLPKGHRENNETYATCARREAEEETGLILNIKDSMPKIKINNTYYFPMVLKTMNKLIPKDNNEILCARWFSIKNWKDVPTNRETQIFFRRKLQEAKQIINYLNKEKT